MQISHSVSPSGTCIYKPTPTCWPAMRISSMICDDKVLSASSTPNTEPRGAYAPRGSALGRWGEKPHPNDSEIRIGFLHRSRCSLQENPKRTHCVREPSTYPEGTRSQEANSQQLNSQASLIGRRVCTVLYDVSPIGETRYVLKEHALASCSSNAMRSQSSRHPSLSQPARRSCSRLRCVVRILRSRLHQYSSGMRSA